MAEGPYLPPGGFRYFIKPPGQAIDRAMPKEHRQFFRARRRFHERLNAFRLIAAVSGKGYRKAKKRAVNAIRDMVAAWPTAEGAAFPEAYEAKCWRAIDACDKFSASRNELP